MRGLERLGARDWRRIDRNALEADWPQAVPCETGNEPGLKGAAEQIARSCVKCEMSGGATMDEGQTQAGLRVVDLWICPRPLESQRAILKKLTQAAIGSNPNVKPTRAPPDDTKVIEGYSWASNGELFTLRAAAFKIDDAWTGNFQLGRCRSEDVTETWRVDGGQTVRVTRADVERSTTNNERRLWFEYVTTCLLEDRACRDRELDQLWLTLQSRADQLQVTRIQLTAKTCVGSIVSFDLNRTPDGQWEGGLWSPKGK